MKTKNIGDIEKLQYGSLNCKNIVLKWSEEDDKVFDKIIDSLVNAKNVDCSDYNIMCNWLESIKQRLEE